MTKARIGPRKTVAASLLRRLADAKYLNVPDPAQTAADLCLIADCILGEARWSRGGKYPPDVQANINFFAFMVEHRRLTGQTVAAALDVFAR